MTRRLLAAALLACCCIARALPATGQFFAPNDAAATDSVAGDYTRGTEALDQQRWQDAIGNFDRVIAAKSKRADAALYWKAYALNKLGRSSLVAATCDQLRGTYPRSSWNHDCSTLLAAAADSGIYVGHANSKGLHPTPQPNDNGIYAGGPPHVRPLDGDQMRNLQNQLQNMHIQAGPNAEQLRDLQKQVQNMHIEAGLNGNQLRDLQREIQSMHIDAGPNAEQLRNLQMSIQSMPLDAGLPTGNDADLKMLALNSLLQRDSAQAIPVIRNILTGSGTPQLKQRAITALAMSQSPEAQSLLRDVATGKVAPNEQREAVQMLGVFQGKRAADTLADIYRGTSDRSIKRAALSGLFISGNAQSMVDLARNEKDLQLKHDIVAQLALMHDKAATDYMLELLK